jgi:hypothetical protein
MLVTVIEGLIPGAAGSAAFWAETGAEFGGGTKGRTGVAGSGLCGCGLASPAAVCGGAGCGCAAGCDGAELGGAASCVTTVGGVVTGAEAAEGAAAGREAGVAG